MITISSVAQHRMSHRQPERTSNTLHLSPEDSCETSTEWRFQPVFRVADDNCCGRSEIVQFVDFRPGPAPLTPATVHFEQHRWKVHRRKSSVRRLRPNVGMTNETKTKQQFFQWHGITSRRCHVEKASRAACWNVPFSQFLQLQDC